MSMLTVSVSARNETPIDYKLATRLSELKRALRLVYDSYLEVGLIRANPHRLRVTPWHLLSSTDVLIACKGYDAICTASILRDNGEMGIPLETLFPEEVAARRLQGISFAEVSCLADRPVEGKSSFPILRRFFELIAQSSRYRGIDSLLITVHPHHCQFYQRFLGFEVIGPIRTYQAVQDHPAVPLELDLVRLPIRNPRVNHTLFSRPFSEDELRIRRIPMQARAGLQEAAAFYDVELSRSPAAADRRETAACP